MIIVTGGSGFIGSNIVRELNFNGIEDVLIVDSAANKERNLIQLKFLDLIDKDLFLKVRVEEIFKKYQSYYSPRCMHWYYSIRF